MHSKQRWVLWLILALIIAVATSGPGIAEGPGSLAGRVVNGTSGGPAADGDVLVTLRVFRGEEELPPLETKTDAQGSFRFEGLDTDPELEYWPSATYLGVVYESPEAHRFQAGQTQLSAGLTVFETTDADKAIRIDSAHLIVENYGAVLRISEMHLFGNASDRTYTGVANEAAQGRRTSVFIPLPAEATGLAFPEGESPERYAEVSGGVWDTEPVRPGSGTSVVRLSYHLVLEGNAASVDRRFAYPVDAINLLAAQPGLELQGERLEDQGSVTFQGEEYRIYSAQLPSPDTPLVVRFVASPTEAEPDITSAPSAGAVAPASAGPGNQGLLLRIGAGLALFAAVGAGVYPWLVRRPAPRQIQARANRAREPEVQRRLEALADLDQAFESGSLDEDEYLRRRAEMVDGLKAEWR